MQSQVEKCLDLHKRLQTLCPAPSKNNKIIHIATVKMRVQFAFHEMVQRAHVNQRIKLTEQVANRNSKRLCFGVPILGKLKHDVNEAVVFDSTFDQSAQN